MNGGKTRLSIEWGHLALVVFIAALVIVYLLDARARSLNLNNLLLVQPASILALVLCAVVIRQCFRRKPELSEAEAAERAAAKRIETGNLGRIAAMAGSLGLMAFGLDVVGFDVASWLFIAIGLVICGERRAWVVLLFPTVFVALLVWSYRLLIPYPITLTVF